MRAPAAKALAAGGQSWASFADVLGAAELALTAQSLTSADSAEPAPPVPAEAFAEILQMKGPPQFFLRQFRSVADGLRASPQQITTSGLTVNTMKGRLLSGPFEFELQPWTAIPPPPSSACRARAPRRPSN